MFAIATKATVWLAMMAWSAAIVLPLRRPRITRAAWTVGFVAYLLHILSAFQSHYDWSHEVAWAVTARQTAEVTGWDSGIGLWFNYLFAAILLADLIVLWTKGTRKWPRLVDAIVFFMILNGAVVFGSGPVRLLGVALCLAILAAWIVRARGSSSPASSPPR